MAVRQSSGTVGAALFCHGNSLAAELFHKQLRSSLGERIRLIAVDLPGHGDSPDVPDLYSPPALVGTIIEVIEELDLQRPVLVGHSLGGHLMTAVASAVAEPRGLFLIGTPLLTSAAAAGEAFQLDTAAGLLFKQELDDAEVSSLSTLLIPGGGADAELVKRAVRRTDPRFRSSMAAALQNDCPDEVALARTMQAPVALTLGAEDPVINHSYMERLELPNLWRGEIQFIDDAGHVPQLDAPERLNELLKEFMDEVL